MFALTERLALRPGWGEDAAELAKAIGHWDVVRNLARAPWPYGEADAAEFLSLPRRPGEGVFLVCERANGRIVGCVGFEPAGNGRSEFGYWITPDRWGRGYATEAGRAAVEAARALGIRRFDAGHFLDNPASGRVLQKLGFRPNGVRQRFSRARGHEAACAEMALDLDAPMVSTERAAA